MKSDLLETYNHITSNLCTMFIIVAFKVPTQSNYSEHKKKPIHFLYNFHHSILFMLLCFDNAANAKLRSHFSIFHYNSNETCTHW